jgi:hypothetical protein
MLKPNTYKVLQMAVEEGVVLGLNRAYKYEDNPTEDHIQNQVVESVLNALLEWFDVHQNEPTNT